MQARSDSLLIGDISKKHGRQEREKSIKYKGQEGRGMISAGAKNMYGEGKTVRHLHRARGEGACEFGGGRGQSSETKL